MASKNTTRTADRHAIMQSPSPDPSGGRRAGPTGNTGSGDIAQTRVRVRKSAIRRLGSTLLPISGLMFLLVAWQLAVVAFHVRPYLVPRPTVIPSTLVDSRSVLWPATVQTGKEALIGFALAAATAVPLALTIATVRIVERTVYPVMVVIQTIPKIAIGPLLVIWFGFGIVPKVLLVYLLTFFPILVSATTGFKSLDVRLLYLTRSMGASRWQTMIKLRIPEAMPQIFAGLEVGIVFSTTAALVAEFIGSTSGLGYLLLQSENNLNTPLAFGIMVIISLMGVLFSGLLIFAKRLTMPWNKVN